MFSAIWRYFRAFGYLITGRIDSARMALIFPTSEYLSRQLSQTSSAQVAK